MNAILKIDFEDELKARGIRYSKSKMDYDYYNQMLEEHDFDVIDFRNKTYEEISQYRDCYAEIGGYAEL